MLEGPLAPLRVVLQRSVADWLIVARHLARDRVRHDAAGNRRPVRRCRRAEWPPPDAGRRAGRRHQHRRPDARRAGRAGGRRRGGHASVAAHPGLDRWRAGAHDPIRLLRPRRRRRRCVGDGRGGVCGRRSPGGARDHRGGRVAGFWCRAAPGSSVDRRGRRAWPRRRRRAVPDEPSRRGPRRRGQDRRHLGAERPDRAVLAGRRAGAHRHQRGDVVHRPRAAGRRGRRPGRSRGDR